MQRRKRLPRHQHPKEKECSYTSSHSREDGEQASEDRAGAPMSGITEKNFPNRRTKKGLKLIRIFEKHTTKQFHLVITLLLIHFASRIWTR